MKRPVVDEQLCIGCASCFLVCPVDAMDVYIVARVTDACIGCGRCEWVCPCGAITMVESEKKSEDPD